MKKEIKYKVVARSGAAGSSLYAVKITQQTHRSREFGDGFDHFVASNGTKLYSRGCPAVLDKSVYLRGTLTNKDKDLLLFDSTSFRRFEEAVEEYNKRFSEPEFKKIVMFKYLGGSEDGYRRLGLIEETPRHLKGIDLDKDAYRCYLKKNIIGKVMEVKE